MPPSVRITEELILDAAVELVRERGADSVNARELAKTLGCSVQPIFRVFGSMENLKQQLYKRAEGMFDAIMTQEIARWGIPFLGRNLAYVEFANEERNLYRFLFGSGVREAGSILERIKEQQGQAKADQISAMMGISETQARQLTEDTWLITQGLAALAAENPSKLREEEMVRLLNVVAESFMGLGHEMRKKQPGQDKRL